MDIRVVMKGLEKLRNYLDDTNADAKTREAYDNLRNEITKGILFMMELRREADEK